MSEVPSTDSKPACACGSWWQLPLLLAAVLAVIVLVRTSGIRESKRVTHKANDAAVPAPATGETVSLEIKFSNDRTQQFGDIAWYAGMTVDDLLTMATRSPDGFRYEVLADGEHALLVSIDDAVNEGGGGRNWTYSVNGQLGDRSFAIYELEPGDRVLWNFGRRP